MTAQPLHGARRWALWGVLALGVAVRLAYVDRPFDGRINNAWRQADYFQLARNFHREDANILHPRVDWRADTPGLAEMEFPLLPWLAGQLYRATGERVQVFRALSAGLEIAAFLTFAWLARRLVGWPGDLFAIAVVAVNPILVVGAGSLQPEPLLHLSSLLAIVLLWRWQQAPRPALLLGAAAMLAIAMLAKASAAYLGLVFAAMVLRTLGRRALTDPLLYGAAALAVLPAAAWYSWAHTYWLRHGLSLGLSNESHLIGWDLLLPPTFLIGIARSELLMVFGVVGWLLALAALRLPAARWSLPLLWFAAACVFYLVSGRTSGDWWANYYHMASIAPASLLMGLGLEALLQDGVAPLLRTAGLALAAATLLASAAITVERIRRRDYDNEYVPMYACMSRFIADVPVGERIVVRGGTKLDELGHPVAHNESMAFAWMDRKGFNYADEDLSPATLDAIAARGGRYWIAAGWEIARKAGGREAAARLRRVAGCDGDRFVLFDLTPAAGVTR